MGVKILALRHKTAPLPNACRWCGIPQREHDQRWVPSKRWHGYTPPTQEQIGARMRSRLNNRMQVPEIVRLPGYEGAVSRGQAG